MTDLATLQDQLAKLENARAAGLRRVESGGDSLEYEVGASLDTAIADLRRRIAEASGTALRRVYITSSKGLNHA